MRSLMLVTVAMLSMLIGCKGPTYVTAPSSLSDIDRDVVNRAALSVYLVHGQFGANAGHGSAVAISKNRLLTAAHVVYWRGQLADKVHILAYYGSYPLPAKVIYIDTYADLAMLEIDAEMQYTAEVDTDARLYEPVLLLGWQNADITQALVVTDGRYCRSDSGAPPVFTSPGYFGVSGGGIFICRDGKMKLTAIVQAVYSDRGRGAIYHLMIGSRFEHLDAFLKLCK